MQKNQQARSLYGALLALLAIGALCAAFFSPLICVLTQAVALVLMIVFRQLLVPEKGDADPNLDALETPIPRAPANLPFPYVVLTEEGGILRYNRVFQKLCGEGELSGALIQNRLPGLDPEKEEQQWRSGEQVYHVYARTLPILSQGVPTGNRAITLCFVDISDLGRMQGALSARRTAVGLIYIDNYDEVLSTVDDSQAPLLTAMIDKKLNDMAEGSGGFCRKLEKDRYLCLLSMDSLTQLRQKRFEQLGQIRAIKVGEHIPVTISMGFGLNDASLLEALRDARSAMDLALGRGGDQAVVKEAGKLYFYGGKAGETGHNARIRARIKADAFFELLDESDQVFVMGHRMADLDSFGSCLGVYRMARSAGKPCRILMESFATGLDRLRNRLAEDEEYKNLFATPRQVLDALTERSLLVVVDTHIPEMVDAPAVLENCRRVVVLDHHRKSVSFIEKAILVYHEPVASSTSEMVAEMIQYRGERAKLKKVEADALLGGITVDTRGFSGKTGAITFETAAFLKRIGADGVRVRKLLQSDLASCKIRAAAVQTARIFDGKVALAVCQEGPSTNTVLAAQTADELLDVAGVAASFVLCRMENIVYVSARSLGEINVQVIMERMGGGGHQTVAGGQFAGKTTEEVEKMVQDAVTAYLREEN